MDRYSGLDAEQKVALLALLRAAAEAELDTEDARVKLCELPDFKPRACFQDIQGNSVKGWMSASDLHLWLSSQPHPVAGYRLEDVLSAIRLRTGSLDIFPEDFIRMTTPNFRSGAYLKELAISRSVLPYLSYERPLKYEVAYRLSQLFLLELDFMSRLRFHQKRLRQVAITGVNIVKFLDMEEGFCAGMGGLLSAMGVRHVLSKGVAGYTRPLEPMLCDALMKRINPTDAAFFPADHLGRLIDMPLPSATQYYTWAERMERSPLTDSYIFRSTSPARLSFESPLLEPSPSSRIRPSSPRAMSPTRRSSPFMEPLSPMSPVTPLPNYLQPDSRPPRHFGSRDWESKDWKARSPSPARRHYLSELSTQDPGLSSFERSLADTYVSSPVPYSPRTPRPMSAGISAAASPGASPSLGSPLPRRSLHFLDTHEQRAVQQTLIVMARQAKLDSMVEDAKTLLPPTCTVEEIFNELDMMRDGYITLRDIRRFMAGFGFTAKYASFTGLVNDLHMRRKVFHQHSVRGARPLEWSGFSALLPPESLDLRDTTMLTLPFTGEGCKAVMACHTDAEAASVLYLLRKSVACPTCGTRAQRDADAAGCPMVTCPVCRTQFHCHTVEGDRPEVSYPLTSSAKHSLYRLLGTTLEAAEELDLDRRELATVLSQEICGLHDVFGAISPGTDSFTQSDLRRCFAVQGLPLPPAEQWDLLWHRYCSPNAIGVNYLDFKNQLQPMF